MTSQQKVLSTNGPISEITLSIKCQMSTMNWLSAKWCFFCETFGYLFKYSLCW